MKKIYENPNKNYWNKEDAYKKRNVMHCHQILSDYVKGKVLDVGAGRGEVTEKLTRNPQKVICLDLNKNSTRSLKKKVLML